MGIAKHGGTTSCAPVTERLRWDYQDRGSRDWHFHHFGHASRKVKALQGSRHSSLADQLIAVPLAH
jgi:hypothetical protein